MREEELWEEAVVWSLFARLRIFFHLMLVEKTTYIHNRRVVTVNKGVTCITRYRSRSVQEVPTTHNCRFQVASPFSLDLFHNNRLFSPLCFADAGRSNVWNEQ